jgi:hypothetical protein
VKYDADMMSRQDKITAWVGGLFVLAVMLFTVVEASVGHDGLLCEWGYGGPSDSGCG